MGENYAVSSTGPDTQCQPESVAAFLKHHDTKVMVAKLCNPPGGAAACCHASHLLPLVMEQDWHFPSGQKWYKTAVSPVGGEFASNSMRVLVKIIPGKRIVSRCSPDMGPEAGSKLFLFKYLLDMEVTEISEAAN